MIFISKFAQQASVEMFPLGVLFVVPSEPLVWQVVKLISYLLFHFNFKTTSFFTLLFFLSHQVAGMIEKLVPNKVALCTDINTYRPEYRPEPSLGQAIVVIGTPSSLESGLTKVRKVFELLLSFID